MSKYKHIFKPIKIGSKTVRNRIELSPVGPLLATGGLVTRELIEWGRTFAGGGAGIVTIGDSAINPPASRPLGNALNLGSDRAIDPLHDYAEAVQANGARASIQLNYHAECSPADMTEKDIADVILYFSQAANRCLSAGMDMIMIHGAHGQLISQFVSPRKNSRTDAYGGNLINRARLVREILEALRSALSTKVHRRKKRGAFPPTPIFLDHSVYTSHERRWIRV